MQSIVLGKLDLITPGHARSFQVNGEEIAVFRQRDGRIFAIQNRCPHRQGPLVDGLAGDGRVICPLHSHKFDLATGNGSEKHECVKTYPLEIIDGAIHLLQ